jgi:hypothetical protein
MVHIYQDIEFIFPSETSGPRVREIALILVRQGLGVNISSGCETARRGLEHNRREQQQDFRPGPALKLRRHQGNNIV